MDADRLGLLAARATRFTYGPVLRYLRERNMRTLRREPAWRRPGAELTTGYARRW